MIFGRKKESQEFTALRDQFEQLKKQVATKEDFSRLLEGLQHLNVVTKHRFADELLPRHGLLIERVHTTYEIFN